MSQEGGGGTHAFAIEANWMWLWCALPKELWKVYFLQGDTLLNLFTFFLVLLYYFISRHLSMTAPWGSAWMCTNRDATVKHRLQEMSWLTGLKLTLAFPIWRRHIFSMCKYQDIQACSHLHTCSNCVNSSTAVASLTQNADDSRHLWLRYNDRLLEVCCCCVYMFVYLCVTTFRGSLLSLKGFCCKLTHRLKKSLQPQLG